MNIPEGLQTSKNILNKHHLTLGVKPSNDNIVKLLEIVLTKKQLPIWWRPIPTNIRHRNWQQSSHCICQHVHEQFRRQICLHISPTTDDMNPYEKRIEHIDRAPKLMSPNNQFHSRNCTKRMTFLGTKVTKRSSGESWVTDRYCKPTDSHSYLLYNSAYPQKCKDPL